MQSNHIEAYRIKAFKYFLFLLLLGGLYFTYLNIIRETYGVALLDATFSVISCVLLIYVYTSTALRYLSIIIKATLALFFIAILLTLWLVPSISITLSAWVFLVPPLSYLLLGRLLGGLYTSIYVALMLLIFVSKFLGDNWADNIFLVGNLMTCFVIVWWLVNLYEASQEKFYQEQIDLATKDSVTGFLNRTTLKQEYARCLAESLNKQAPLSLVLISVDWFETLIERYGYAEGNKLLSKLAASIRPLLREQDVVFHFGGDEFCVLLPSTNLKQASAIVDEYRMTVMNNFSNYENKHLSITLSAGVVACTKADVDFTHLLMQADARLYKAKELGANQVALVG